MRLFDLPAGTLVTLSTRYVGAEGADGSSLRVERRESVGCSATDDFREFSDAWRRRFVAFDGPLRGDVWAEDDEFLTSPPPRSREAFRLAATI